MFEQSIRGTLLVLALIQLTAPARAQSDVYADELFAFYSTANERVTQEGTTRYATWQLQAQFRAFSNTDFPAHSVLRWELRQGERRVAGARCRPNISALRTTHPTEPQLRVMLTTTACQDNDTNIRETGELTVVWFYVDGATDAEQEIARHTIVARELPVYSRALPPVAQTPHIIIDRHGEVASSFIIQDHFRGGVGPAMAERPYEGSNVYLVFNASTAIGDPLNQASLRCRVDGAPAAIAHDAISGRGVQEELDSGWLPNPAGDTIATSATEEYVRFRRYVLTLPLNFAPLRDDGYNAGERLMMRAGAWECDLRSADSVTLRTFRWTVGEDGRVLPHAEETEGGLRLGPGIHFVETVFPPEHPLDARTDPAATARAFHGRGFRSVAGRAIAASVPSAGAPYPVAPRAGHGSTRAGARPRH